MKLLADLYNINSKSGQEDAMRTYILEFLAERCPKALVKVDETGNIYVTKGNSETYPVIASHLDEVHAPCNTKTILSYGGLYFGYSVATKSPVGIGADDKNGIWVALKMLLKFKVLKAVFFVSEETGCQGSAKADMSFFDNARFVVQCDRKGGSDFINVANSTELCSKEFINAIGIKDYGYNLVNGFTTDVYKLKTRGLNVCCVNLSCGYYNPHTSTECTVIDELRNCRNLVEHMIRTLTDVYPHEYKPYSYASYQGGYGYGGGTSYNSGFQSKNSNKSFSGSTGNHTKSGKGSTSYDIGRQQELYILKEMIDDYLMEAPVTAHDAWKFWKECSDLFDYIYYPEVKALFEKKSEEYAKTITN